VRRRKTKQQTPFCTGFTLEGRELQAGQLGIPKIATEVSGTQ